MGGNLLRFDGWIFGAAFASGDRFVAGRWPVSPLGSFADVMWARPDRTRVLLAPTEDILGFVGRHYVFEEQRVTPVHVDVTARRLRVAAPPLVMELDMNPPGTLSWLLSLRPRWLRTSRPWIAVEDAALRPLVTPLLGGGAGIRARGRTNAGAREWYAIHAYRSATARAWLEGVDLGHAVPGRAGRFGFSEFPPTPAAVRVTSMIER